jgi:hypothetical protein
MHRKSNKIIKFVSFFENYPWMLNNTLRAGAASRYGSGSDQMKGLLAAPAPQHCKKQSSNALLRWRLESVSDLLTIPY